MITSNYTGKEECVCGHMAMHHAMESGFLGTCVADEWCLCLFWRSHSYDEKMSVRTKCTVCSTIYTDLKCPICKTTERF